MIAEVLHFLNLKPGHSYIDGTLGLGGHLKAVYGSLEGKGQFYGFDRNERAIDLARHSLPPCVELIQARYSQIPALMGNKKGSILLDLGISSWQLDEPDFGISFKSTGPLDMRLDPECQFTAAEILNDWSEKKLIELFEEKGDLPRAKKLVQAIIAARPLESIPEFVKICADNLYKGKLNASTLPLMALRLEVNQELEELALGLEKILNWMEPGARLVVISFHSGEDRLVKNIFKKYTDLSLLTPKPLSPTLAEIKSNPRSRSAKLRAIEKL